MSDYSEHLISMAGGDGDALDHIQARHDEQATYSWPGLAHEAHLDRAALLAMVREQRAAIERVERVCADAKRHINSGIMGQNGPVWVNLEAIRAALTATEPTK